MLAETMSGVKRQGMYLSRCISFGPVSGSHYTNTINKGLDLVTSSCIINFVGGIIRNLCINLLTVYGRSQIPYSRCSPWYHGDQTAIRVWLISS